MQTYLSKHLTIINLKNRFKLNENYSIPSLPIIKLASPRFYDGTPLKRKEKTKKFWIDYAQEKGESPDSTINQKTQKANSIKSLRKKVLSLLVNKKKKSMISRHVSTIEDNRITKDNNNLE